MAAKRRGARGQIGRANPQSPDFARLREAFSGPGADTRRWAAYAVVDDDADAVEIDEHGVWLDCTIVETGEPIRVRWGLMILPGGRGGVWLPPPERGEEILAVFNAGDPSTAIGAYTFADADAESPGGDDYKLPAAIISEPNAVHIRGANHAVRIDTDAELTARAGTKTDIDSPDVNLGGTGLLPTQGVVNGEGVDPYTGATYAALGNASTIVKAKKS